MWSLETETRAGRRNYRSCIILLMLFLAIIASSGVETLVNGLLTYFDKEPLGALSNLDTQILFYTLIAIVIICPMLLHFVEKKAGNPQT